MKSISEIGKSIDLLINYPDTFGWAQFFDNYNPCAPHKDRMDFAENVSYADTYSAVLKAMPKYSERHVCLASRVVNAMGQKQIRYDDLVKILARVFMDDKKMKDSSSVAAICLFVDKVHRYMEDNGIRELTARDMENIFKDKEGM